MGGAIPTLRVGVVDAQGKETRWLPIPMPAEGFYLGQVDWAGNSHELLIEKLSRFRNEREFLLADIRTGALRRIFHETDPAWVDASQRSNAGWTWIRGGQAFIVLSEKDGWRHAYVYSRDGKELALLTPGKFDIIERAVVDESGGWYLLLRVARQRDPEIPLSRASGWNRRAGTGHAQEPARHA